MALIDRTGFIHDRHAGIDSARHQVVANDVDAATLVDALDGLDLLVVEFPSSADGRGFSLARRLRHLGYEGELRARGPLIADQFAFALACGFDTVEVPAALAARQPEAQWLSALDSVDDAYQAGYLAGSILERRAAARAAAPARLAA